MKYKTVFDFEILWAGWECDYDAIIAEKKNGKLILMIKHNNEYHEEKFKLLEDKIKEYEIALYKTKQALSLLKKQE